MNENIKDGETILLDGKPRVTYLCDQKADCTRHKSRLHYANIL